MPRAAYREQAAQWVGEAFIVAIGVTVANGLVVAVPPPFFEQPLMNLLLVQIVTFIGAVALIYRLFYHVDTVVLSRLYRVADELRLVPRGETPPSFQELETRRNVTSRSPKRDPNRGGTPPSSQELDSQRKVTSQSPKPDPDRGATGDDIPRVDDGLYKCQDCLHSLHGYEKARKHSERTGHSVLLVDDGW